MPRYPLTSLRISQCTLLFSLAAVGLLALTGCGSKGGGGKDPAAPSDNPAGETGSQRDGLGAKIVAGGAHVDEEGRVWVSKDIPLDVWQNDPLAVANQQGKVADPQTDGGSEAPTTSSSDSGSTPSTPTPTPAATAGGGPNWKEIIPGTVLDNEVKKVNNRFTAKLQTLATFNSSFLELPPHVATMAALSHIASEHPDDIRWKDQAKQIRDLSASMLSEDLQRGAKSYKQMNDPYLKINDILAGSPPGDLAAPKPGDDFSEFAVMGLLMKRLEIGLRWLQVNVSNEAALKQNADDVKHEAAILAALVTAVTTEGYGFAEDEEFKGMAKEAVDACQKVIEAAGTGSYENYQLSHSAIDQACNKCHGSYK